MGKPVFITERLTYDTNERPIEYRKSIIRSDKFRFSVELK
jgi:DNA-binding GntR family transcriptional regulator